MAEELELPFMIMGAGVGLSRATREDDDACPVESVVNLVCCGEEDFEDVDPAG